MTNTNADGSVMLLSNGFVLIGGNNGSGNPGTTDYTATAIKGGTVNFNWSYSSMDTPTFDFAGYLVGGNFVSLADTNGESGTGSFAVNVGQIFGFRVATADNQGEPGILTVTNPAAVTGTPEPGTGFLVLFAMLVTVSLRAWKKERILNRAGAILVVFALTQASDLAAQTQFSYTGSNITGQLVLTGAVNLRSQAHALRSMDATAGQEPTPKAPIKLLPPQPPFSVALQAPAQAHGVSRSSLAAMAGHAVQGQPTMQPLPIVPASGSYGFPGLSHYDQRNANNGNQYSVEPPSPVVAVGSNYVLEGVNNAIQVFSKSGTPLSPVLATNQVFGLAPAINRATNVAGVFPTDIRVFYDSSIDRWFIVQRAQCCDTAGNNIRQSQIYIAVSQTGDPTSVYNEYYIDTTDSQRAGCPCVADYPQLGADQYGFYISSNEYPIDVSGNPSQYPIGASILAISKAALGSGATAPTTYKFFMPVRTGYEFTIQPAATPAGGSYFVASGGVEFFVSDIATGNGGLSIWAMANTVSLTGANPSPTLTQIAVPVLAYSVPPNAFQKPGPIPYGSSLGATEAVIDTSDCRILSVEYVGGRLYATLGTTVQDANFHLLAGSAYLVFSPTFRGGILSGSVVGQGYVLVNNENLLRPAIAVNPQGQGAVAFTLVGPDYYPSAAYVTFSASAVSGFSTGSAVQVAALGSLPEDGFTGYQQGVARWGDYSTAVAAGDGSIWMSTEYIPNAPRTQFANWGTFVVQYVP